MGGISHFKPITKNQILKTLVTFGTWAEKRGHLIKGSNPFIGMVRYISLLPLAFGASGNIETGRNEDTILGATFWLVVTLAFMFTPMRALFSVGSERKQHALETILLTKAGCSRVAYGTWCSFMAQNALFFTSVLPYLLARYLLGGEEIVQEVLNLLSVLVISGSVTATAIAISAAPSIKLKLVVLLLLGGVNVATPSLIYILAVSFVFVPWYVGFLFYNLITVPITLVGMIALAQDSLKSRR